jgi:hypothetical protein
MIITTTKFGPERTLTHAKERQLCALVGRSTEVRLSSKADIGLASVIDHHGPKGGRSVTLRATSAFPPQAELHAPPLHVAEVPEADMAELKILSTGVMPTARELLRLIS